MNGPKRATSLNQRFETNSDKNYEITYSTYWHFDIIHGTI